MSKPQFQTRNRQYEAIGWWRARLAERAFPLMMGTVSAQQERDRATRDGDGPRPTELGLIAESDVEVEAVRAVARQLESSLAERVDGDRQWRVTVAKDAVPLNREGRIRLQDHADGLRRRHDCDLVVYFTDLPHLEHAVCNTTHSTNESFGVVSLKVMSASAKPRLAGQQPSAAVGCSG